MNFSYSGIFGFDLSHWQDINSTPQTVDFQKMRNYGARFAIIRAGNGLVVDSDFVTNWKNAKGVIPRGSYWYFNNQQAPKAQAAKYRDTLESDPDGICVWDLEDRTPGSYTGWRAWYDCLEYFKSITGLASDQIWIYTGLFYFEEFTMNATDAQREYFKQFPLFLASYTQDPFRPNYAAIRLPRPFTHCTMLQSGTPAIGIEAGAESLEIDYDLFNGNEAEFAKYFKATGEPQPPPIGEAMQGTIKSLTNIRNGAGAAFTDIGDLLTGDIITSDRDTLVSGVKWYHLTNATRNGQPIITLGGLNVSQRADCWAYGPNIEPIGEPEPVPGLPVLNVTVSGEGYITQIVELRPR